MQTLVIRIPDDLAKTIEDEAKRLNLTKSEVARRRLVFSQDEKQPLSGFDLIADLVGTVAGGPKDMSVNKKAYLKSKEYGKPRSHR
jgi:hypothetical protein